MKKELLYAKHISCPAADPPVYDFSFQFFEGEIIALLGLDGSGKQTAINIISGEQETQTGGFYMAGRKLPPLSRSKAREYGVFKISSSDMMVQTLNCVDAVCLFLQNRRSWSVNRTQIKKQLLFYIDRFELSLPLNVCISELSALQVHILCLLCALICDAKLIVCDRFLDAYSNYEISMVQRIFHRLKRAGLTILISTNKVSIAVSVADQISVMKAGYICAIVDQEQFDRVYLYRMLSEGQPQAGVAFPTEHGPRAVVLACRNVSWDGLFSHASVNIRAGEVVSFVDARGSAIPDALQKMLLSNEIKGDFYLNGSLLKLHRVGRANRSRIAFFHGDFDAQYFRNKTVAENILLLEYSIAPHEREKYTKKYKRFLLEEYAGVLGLSKELLCKPMDALTKYDRDLLLLNFWLINKPDVLVMIDPYKAADTKTFQMITGFIDKYRVAGMAVILLSVSGLEIKSVCDTIYQISNGSLVQITDYSILE